MKTILTAAFGLLSSTSIALSASTISEEDWSKAQHEYQDAVYSTVQLEMCRPSDFNKIMNFRQIRSGGLQAASELSGRPIQELIVETGRDAERIVSSVRREGLADDFCKKGRAKRVYGLAMFDEQVSEGTLKTIAALDQVAVEIPQSKAALTVCDLSEDDANATRKFVKDAQRWSYKVVKMSWNAQSREIQNDFAESLASIADKESLCSRHSAFLGKLKVHPVHKYAW